MNISDEDSFGKEPSTSGILKLNEMNNKVYSHTLADLGGGSGASPLD